MALHLHQAAWYIYELPCTAAVSSAIYRLFQSHCRDAVAFSMITVHAFLISCVAATTVTLCCTMVATQSRTINFSVISWLRAAVCAWTGDFLTGSTLAVESRKFALLHLHCFSSQLTGFFILQTAEAFLWRHWAQRLLQFSTMLMTSPFSPKCRRFFCWLWTSFGPWRKLAADKDPAHHWPSYCCFISSYIRQTQVLMLWNHWSTFALKFTVLIALKKKCVAGLAWPKAVSTSPAHRRSSLSVWPQISVIWLIDYWRST